MKVWERIYHVALGEIVNDSEDSAMTCNIQKIINTVIKFLAETINKQVAFTSRGVRIDFWCV